MVKAKGAHLVVAAESLINEDLMNSDELLCYPVTLTYTLLKSWIHFIYLPTGAVGSGPACLTIILLRKKTFFCAFALGTKTTIADEADARKVQSETCVTNAKPES